MIPTETLTFLDAVQAIADDVLRQIEDNHAPHRTYTATTAAGDNWPTVRVYFADVPSRWHPLIPAGVVRVALDVAPISPRNPAHEVRVFFENTVNGRPWLAADSIAAAVLDRIDNTAEYAR